MKPLNRLKFMALAMLPALIAAATAQPPAAFTDPRDGQAYRTVKIGGQVWMAENLNYQTDSSRCYNDSASYCKKYGRLYTWYDAHKACPAGWHLPSNKEYQELVNFVGGWETAGTKLKSKTGWFSDKEGYKPATDEYGFSALPGGYCNFKGDFNRAGYCGYWWSATELLDTNEIDDEWDWHKYNAFSWHMCYWDKAMGGYEGSKSLPSSVRCLRDD